MTINAPPHWFLEPLMSLAATCAEHTMVKRPIARISLATDFGLQLGIAPGTSMDVHTPAGHVEVYCERMPRAEGTLRVP
jgi:hypothetical protein